MPRFTTAAASFRTRTEDRAIVLSMGDRHVIAIADGSGGASGASTAAETFVAGVQRAVSAPAVEFLDPGGWLVLLQDLDAEISRHPAAGETTGIALAVTATAVVGASVGDSRAWIFNEETTELTRNQVRKPRLGSGRAEPRPFFAPASGTLVVGTDGLFDHASIDDIASVARARPSPDAAERLIDILRHRYRALPDDVAVVIGWLEGV